MRRRLLALIGIGYILLSLIGIAHLPTLASKAKGSHSLSALLTAIFCYPLLLLMGSVMVESIFLKQLPSRVQRLIALVGCTIPLVLIALLVWHS